MSIYSGFSKLDRGGQLDRLLEAGVVSPETRLLLDRFLPAEPEVAALFSSMTENVLSTWYLPYSIAPGFRINGREYAVPMVTEESSVVAAASWSARYWASRGGFVARVTSETKVGHISFRWAGDPARLRKLEPELLEAMRGATAPLTAGMEKHGGGMVAMELIDLTKKIPDIYQVRVSFRTGDAMGANFINGCLEAMVPALTATLERLAPEETPAEVILAILSNHTPECRVTCTVSCDINELTDIKGDSDPAAFARRFELAVRIAQADPYRAVTHNKGIFNGIDSVLLATANDFRAAEAGGHAWASRSGEYSSLTDIDLTGDRFTYTLDLPLAVGTVGGLTRTHPLAAASLKILGEPSAAELMQIAAAAGLANNFSAIKALITHGIQAGHMPLHHRKRKDVSR